MNKFSLLSILDDAASKVVLDDGEEYQSTTTTLSFAVVQRANESKVCLTKILFLNICLSSMSSNWAI